jgi:5-formyltetrahydrofolate cyclo-ligase
MSDIQELKAMCRKAAFAARKDAHGAGLDKEANAQLTSFLKMQGDDLVIAAYMPIRTEVSPLKTMENMARRGRDICVPVVIGNGQPLEFHRWTPDGPMVEGAFGAMIPATRDVMEPDVIITPLAAFDMNGYRLGYGGGFYDRSFAQLSEKKQVQAIGFAYDAQEVMIVPREDTDFRLNAVITEKGILSFDQ